MTVDDLKKIVDRVVDQGGGDKKVCIPNNKPSVGPIGHTNVKLATSGFDWEMSLFLIYPEKKMKEME